jgi:hypothetical protein
MTWPRHPFDRKSEGTVTSTSLASPALAPTSAAQQAREDGLVGHLYPEVII